MNDIMPIFITGVYRSGTTLLSRILNNHSKLNITYDNVHFMRFCYGHFDPIDSPQNYKALIENVKKRVDKRMNGNWKTNSVIERLRNTRKINYAVVYNEIMHSLIQETPSCRWGEKTMICWSKIPDFLSMFPEGKTLHIIRDVRDVLASFKRVTNEPGLRYLDAIFTTLHSMEWALKEGRKLSKKNYLGVQYEQLVTKPVEVVKDICTFLEIEFEERMLDHNQFVDRVGNLWKANTAYNQELSGIQDSSIGNYKDHLSNQEVFLAELVTRNMLTAYGYQLSGLWLTKTEWDALYEILSDVFVSKRFTYWLRTNQGVEEYPSPPPEVEVFSNPKDLEKTCSIVSTERAF